MQLVITLVEDVVICVIVDVGVMAVVNVGGHHEVVNPAIIGVTVLIN